MNDHKRIVVGCDLDDVVADFIKGFMEIAARKYGVDPDLRPTSWEWDGADMTKERVDDVWQEITNTRNWWETLAVETGVSKRVMQRLNNETQLFFPTARAYCVGDPVSVQSAVWLHEHFNISYPTVIVANSKGPLAAALKYDFFIDDRPKNCIEVKTAVPRCRVFMKTATHNLSTDLSESGIPRIATFDEFAETVLSAKLVQEGTCLI